MKKLVLKIKSRRRKLAFLTVLFCLMSASSFVCQANIKDVLSKTISLQFENLPLEKAVSEVESACGCSFFYDENRVDMNTIVSLKVKNQTVEKALRTMLDPTNITFEVVKEYVVLLPKNVMLGKTSSTVVAETEQRSGVVKGTIVDNSGEAVIGATVKVDGTTNGTASDLNGNFTLDNVADGATLEISYIGYITQKVVVKGNAPLNITLIEDSQQLSEVVVTGFGLAQKKATLTGAISAVGSEDLSRSLASTASGALVGKIAGLNTRQSDGRPGASTKLQIRNMGTPLFVIDGTIQDEGQFNNIDFNDIESISVLKDASAAIYGVRAANGVVVVTTKKGQLNTKSTITLNAYYGWQSQSKMSKPADATTYITNYIQSQTIQGTSYKYSKEDYAKWQQGTEKGYVPFDWYDYVWETSPQEYLNASVTGGSDKINYYFSVGHLNQDAMIVNYGGFYRTNIQANIEARISDKLKVGTSINGRIEERKNPGVPGGDDYWAPIFGTYRNLPTARPFANDNPKYPTLTSTDASTNFGWLNYELSGEFKNVWRVMQTDFNVEYEIMDGLKATGRLGYYYAQQRLDNQEYTYKLYGYDEETDTYPVIFENTNPWRERTVSTVEKITTNIQLSYDKIFGNHHVTAVGGFESSQVNNPHFWLHAIPTANNLHLIDYETMDTFNDYGDETEARLGWIGRVNYDFAGKYLLELSGRYDGSWKFPPEDRWGFFPAASAGWRVSEESFFKDSKMGNIFNNLKIRASYGLVGDDNTDGYSAFDYMSGYNYKNGGSTLDGAYVIGTNPRGLPVTTLSWMKAKILDIGIDVGFLNNRLTGQIDYFRRHRTGIPAGRYDVVLPSEVGFSLPNENLNEDLHQGFDAAIRWADKINDINYSVGGNVTYARYYNWETYKPRYGNSWDEYRNGSWHRFANIGWGYEAIGQFQSWDEIASYTIDNDGKGNTTLRPGDIKYKDVNNDGVINGMDYRPIGYSTGDIPPILNYGINLAADWKGFDLSCDFTGSFFSSWMQNYEQRYPFHDGGNNAQYYMEDTWHLSDIWDANSELIPGKYPMLLIGNSGHSNYKTSTFWRKNTRYIKLRNLEFGYTLPKKILSKVGISNLRVYICGQNLFALSNLNGVDPEIYNSAGLAYPTTRIMNLGLTLKF